MKPNMGFDQQQGLVMVIALIMLLAVTLMVVTASNLVQANLKVVQNMESRELARAAVLAAVEEAISSLRFTRSDELMFTDTSAGCLNVDEGDVIGKCFTDYNGDDKNDVMVAVEEPTCVAVTPRRNSDLNVFDSLQEASCYKPPEVYSMCGDAVWEFRATATDVATGASVFIRQGVSVLTSLNNIATNCPCDSVTDPSCPT